MAKRLFDLTSSLLGLLMLSPLFLVVALLVKLDSAGGVLYRGQRVGKEGHLFRIVKFRTMIADAAQRGAGITTRDDPRVTRIGRFLRKTKIDELPQLINVVNGEMSLVGPRPEDPAYVALYTPEQRKLLSIRPGITSLAAIQYRHEEQLLQSATVEAEYRNIILPSKLALDLQYVEQRSFWLDTQILFRTLLALFAGQPPRR